MTAISPRFAGAAAAVLVLSAVPIWFHALTSPTHDDCAHPEAFFGATRIGGAPMSSLEGVLKEFEGAQGMLRSDSKHRMAVRVVRTFDPSLLYASPTKFGFDTLLYLHPAESRRLEAGDDILPVHWNAHDGQSTARIEAYLLVQGGAPVSHPIRSGFALALQQLVDGTRPVTILIVSGIGGRGEISALDSAAERWLVAAWRQLEAACGF